MNRFYIKVGMGAFLAAALVMLATREQAPPRATRAEVDDILHNYFAVDGKSLAIVDADVGFWTEVSNSLHMRLRTDRESGEQFWPRNSPRALQWPTWAPYPSNHRRTKTTNGRFIESRGQSIPIRLRGGT